jgi:hypothetical protein
MNESIVVCSIMKKGKKSKNQKDVVNKNERYFLLEPTSI